MKIIKYLLALIILLSTSISILVTTKKGDYYQSESKIINLPKEKIYSYVSELKNWENFYQPRSNFKQINFSKNTNQINSFINWTDKEGIVDIKTVFLSKNDSISQVLYANNRESEMFWKLKDTLNKTKVLWGIKGNMDFLEKLKTLTTTRLKLEKQNNYNFKEGLVSLEKAILTEVNDYKITINGFVKQDTTFYLQHAIKCKTSELPEKIKFWLPKIKKLITTTHTETKGFPFVIYHAKDSIKNTITFSIAVPTKEKIYTSPGSNIYPGQTMPLQMIKATLKGDYSHKKEAIKKINAFIKKNNLLRNEKHKDFEIIIKDITTEPLVSKWVVEICIPVKPKIAPPKPVVRDSLDIFNDGP
jgi:hypothetical protein